MCYLVAKKFKNEGSIAWKTKHGKELAAFSRYLNSFALPGNIEIVTISCPSAYGEYEPYTIVHSKEEFEKAVRSMRG